MNIKKRTLAVIIAAMLILGAGAGLLIERGLGALGVGTITISSAKYKQFMSLEQKFGKLDILKNAIENKYYAPYKNSSLNEGMYKGLFAGLDDPYSEYMTKAEYDSFKISVSGSFEGIGVTITEDKNGRCVVVSSIPGSPAEASGLKAGDVITKINGDTFDGVSAAASKIRGRAGTPVTVTFERDGKEITKSIIRRKISTEPVTYKVLPGNYGYIKLSEFTEGCAAKFGEAVRSLENKNVKGLIIDLRDDPGGYVSECADIADTLMDKGVITYMEDKHGKRTYYRSDKGRTDLDYVLLVNGGSASASEILSAAVQDSGSGMIIGTKTYGKGIVQETEELEDGSAFKLTVMQYFSPKGRTIHKKGVTPDKIVNGAEAQLKQAQEHLDQLQK